MDSTPEPSNGHAQAWRWWLAAFGLAVVASPVMVWGIFGTPATWAAIAAAVALGLGMVCFVVATILKSRADGVHPLRVMGRALWAPIRFLIEFTF
ncbi:MAG TPA: hypothetical protein VFC06_01590 [Demequina sp.]|nr:hypothetical protein [Demequina sp.]